MSIWIRFIRWLFLVKEIISKEGTVHFRRYRLLSTPWFNIYVHQICHSDRERDRHDHPWDYSSLILQGAYFEITKDLDSLQIEIIPRYAGDVIEHKAEEAHRINLITDEVWTLVVTSKTRRVWGYQTVKGWIDHITYRQLKNKNLL
jgi:hypothetical protein